VAKLPFVVWTLADGLEQAIGPADMSQLTEGVCETIAIFRRADLIVHSNGSSLEPRLPRTIDIGRCRLSLRFLAAVISTAAPSR
jgi:hypothetical protein